MALWMLFITGVLCVLAYLSVSLPISTAVVAATLVLFAKCGDVSAAWPFLAWLLFAAVAIPLNIPDLRRKFLTGPLFHSFREIMPAMSATEREALEAGTVWWDKELFSGKPNWKMLLNFPAPKLTPEEREFINGPANELCRMLDDWRITQELQDLPDEVWDFLKQKGFFGMIIPKKYGGLGFSALAHSQVVMKVASRSVSAAVSVMVPNSLGPAELIFHYGTEKQKDHYLPRLARGEDVPCFALTGPEAGSDAASMPDTGIVCRGDFQGEKDVLGIRLNWDKRYITLAPSATVLGLAFKLFDPDHLLGNKKEMGITLALIPTDTAGITIGSRHFPLNSAFQVGPTWGKDVFIPVDKIIGGPEQAGHGWSMLMECLAVGRSVSLPGLSAGSAKLSSRVIGAYARVRKQFKISIGRFEGVEEGLARIGGNTYLVDAARTMTTCGVDLGEKPSVVSAIVKYHLTERARSTINDAMDIQGGAAICMGPRNLLARVYQSIPICITVEGANILTRSMIIFGQGAIRCHPYLLREMQAVRETDLSRGIEEFDKAITGHVGFVISNAARSLLLGLTGSAIAVTPGSSSTRPYFRQLTRMSAAFVLAADISLLVLGETLKRKEKLSARLADALSHLYLASAALKRFEEQGAPDEDLPFLHWSCQETLYTIQESLDGLLRNFPNRIIALFLRFLLFPLGKPYSPPDDKLGHKVASQLLSPSASRDRLTDGIYVPSELEEPLGRLEDALIKVIKAEPVEKKISQAAGEGKLKSRNMNQRVEEGLKIGIINEEEMTLLRDAAAARAEVVRVDDFPKDKWNMGKKQ